MKKWFLQLLNRNRLEVIPGKRSATTQINGEKPVVQAGLAARNGSNSHNDIIEPLWLASLSVWLEKTSGRGEDAQPINDARVEKGILAVFDGMGGAGANKHRDEDGNVYSEARYAAVKARDSLWNYWKNGLFESHSSTAIDNLSYLLREEFTSLVKQGTHREGLKGTLVKRYPTTLAAIVYHETGNPLRKSSRILSFWAGDSRCYLLLPDIGLKQVSKDDIGDEYDPQSNLTLDAPIKNCIHADGSFAINHFNCDTDLPFIVLVATDGCFHYLPSPMHFEELLLRTMRSSKNISEWQDNLTLAISDITMDDASLALVAYGFSGFSEIQELFATRYDYLYKTFVLPINELNSKMLDYQNQFIALQKSYIELVSSSWKTYKNNYYSSFEKREGSHEIPTR